MPTRLAIVLSHPVQYYSPWFRHLAARPELELKVFYLWDFGVKETRDRAFGNSFVWDIPLLDGYESEFVPNRSQDPGTHHFRGLDNPRAVEAVAAWKPDAVLLFGYAYQTHLRLILSRRLARVPFYFRGDSHDLCRAAGWKSQASRLLRSLIFRRFKGFFAVGQANAGYFRNCGVSSDRIHHVPHCVDNGRFQAAAAQAEIDAAEWKRELDIPTGATVVLFAGKFEDVKRPLDLLTAFLGREQNSGRALANLENPSEALAGMAEGKAGDRGQGAEGERDERSEVKGQRSEIRDTNAEVGASDLRLLTSVLRPPPAVLLFVGSGPLESALREAAGQELGRTVFFAPFQNQSAMPRVYAAGDLLVLSSMSETWGLVVNEAMNLARPAIVSSHVGCGPDLILPGETGWIFPAGDVDALKQTLAEALSDPARLKRMGECARTHIANYSYDRATQAVVEVLRGYAPVSPM